MRNVAIGAALLGALMLASAFPVNAVTNIPTNAPSGVNVPLDPYQPVLLPGSALIFDDDFTGLNAACNGAAKAIPPVIATCTNNAATLCTALTAGTASIISINSQLNSLAIQCANVYGKAAAYANGPGHHLIFQSWDLDICSSFGFCTAGEVGAVLAATGAAFPLSTGFFFTPTPSVSTNGVCLQHLAPAPFASSGGYSTGSAGFALSYARVNQGVGLAATGQSCFVHTASPTVNDVIFKLEPGGSDVYVSMLPGAYKPLDKNGSPGEDMIDLYANLFTWLI